MQPGRAELRSSDTTDGVTEDPTLQDPRCVFQILKRHFARYTPEMVERVCGTPPEQFRAVCEAWTANSNRERTTALVYSVGWTQHSVGAQYIRSGAIVQLLLGNIGRPGGGVFALRGHASIQGSTDIPTLFNLLPGYLPMPSAESSDDLDTYLDAVRSRTQKGYWATADTYMVSLLKEYFGEHATAENDFGFDLPAEDQRRPRHVPHGHGHGGRREGLRLLPARAEPGRRLGARASCSAWAWRTSTGWSSATSP